ncbi:Ras-GAP domain-containing protein [Meloidogyne graminicola]|uniref:Ras-GAP domain-containing protein n=1 Tax=Meloidogyne graminicola TaxID=189291 RepID=A0A8S9ZPD7_9BILA|nr:Ras-GAP domain-containing protein [Meloidogyne graminicola]KAF7634947.1 Ras-GAP domain-containing protein [Meloidogyne graminicola]
MRSNGNRNKENNSNNNNNCNHKRSPRMLSIKQQHKSNIMPCEPEESCASSISSSSSKVPPRFQPSRSPNNRSSLSGLPTATPYLGPSLSPVSSPQWRFTATGNSPGSATSSGRAIPKSALLMSKILHSRSSGVSSMDLVHGVAGTKNILETTNLTHELTAEKLTTEKIIDLSYQLSPTFSPSLIIKMKVDNISKRGEEMEMKIADCIFNFEDIFENEMEGKNEFKKEEESAFGTDQKTTEEFVEVFPEGETSEEIKEGKKDIIDRINEVTSGSSSIIKEQEIHEEKRRTSGKKNRRKKNKKLLNEEQDEDEENSKIKMFTNKLDNQIKNNTDQKDQKMIKNRKKKIPEEIVSNFVFTNQHLTIQVEHVMFISSLEKCSVQVLSTPKKIQGMKKEEQEIKKQLEKSDETNIIASTSEKHNSIKQLNKFFDEKEVLHENLPITETYIINENFPEKNVKTDRPITEQKKDKGWKKGGKSSSKRKGKKGGVIVRKPSNLLQSLDQQQTNIFREKEMEEDLLTSPSSTISSPPALPSCSTAGTSLARGHEQIIRPASSIGRMIGRWRHTTGGIQLRNITFSSVWEKLVIGGARSDCREPFRTSTVQLNDNMRYNMEVLPLIHYRPLYHNLIRSIHFSPASHSFISLIQCLPIDIENLARPLMKIFIHSSQIRQFFRLICFEYLSTCSDVNTLFRSQSLASKVMYEMMKCVGHKYLVVTLTPLIDLIFAERKCCEIDPSKLRPGESLDKNIRNIIVYAELAFGRVVDSSQRCPHELRELFAELRDVVEQFFPGREDVGRLALSSFLILRFFAAAILNPKLFALKMATPDVNISRTLVLVSKILQRVANCVVSANPPTTKEQWLTPVLHQFLDEAHNKAMIDFLDEISMSFTETEEVGENTSSDAAVVDDESSQIDSFTPKDVSNPEMDIEKELHIVYSQIVDHLDTLCSMGWCCRYECSCCSTTIVQ